MSAIAQYLERDGLATVVVSILREHTERMMPPRSLWVPFELGRPLGPPGFADYQRRIVRAALALLEAPAGPLIQDFTEPAPQVALGPDDVQEGWVCPVSFGPPPSAEGSADELVERVLDEIARLRPWFDRRRAAGHPSTVGPSGCAPEDIPPYLKAVLDGGRHPLAGRGLDIDQSARFAVQDLKAFYTEAATAQGKATATAPLQAWFWRETAAALLLFRLADALVDDPEVDLHQLGLSGIVPNDSRIKAEMAKYLKAVAAR